MSVFIAEFIGTALLILLGNGVVANVVLAKTKGNGSGLIVICFGWAIGVFVGVYVAATHSGAHLNPAVTIALALLSKISWSLVPQYISAQMLGAMAGTTLVWVAYKQHYDATANPADQLASFCNTPAIDNSLMNFLTEAIATFAFMIGVLFIATPQNSLGSLDALPVALVVLGIGLSLGGPTGYAINPARDLGPRIMHAILPIKGKGSSNWSYSWIPVIGPIVGAVLAAVLYGLLTGH